MNHYVNCTPKSCEEYESVTLDIPTEFVDEVLYYARTLADEKNIQQRRAFGDLVRNVYQQLTEKSYDRKNRKNGKRRGRDR
jgi:hypothetical protein|tara:strand:- start:18207 stop:18449 length:243 start_codon:yes stop_codon:yes gene_type:complete